MKKKINLKKFTFVATVFFVFLLLVVLINFVAMLYDVRFDVTENKQHTLIGETQDLLATIRGEIRITALYVGMPPKYLEDLLKEYERQAKGVIKTEIVDPLVDLGYAAQFGNIINEKERKVIVQSGKQRRDVDFSDTLLTQEQLNNALVRITRPEQKVCFTSGHNEYDIFSEENTGLSKFVQHLNANNILTDKILLEVTGGVPDACDALVVAGAKNRFTTQEGDWINAYLENGGDALFLIENVIVSTPEVPLTKDQLEKNPSLNEILKNWGIAVNQDVVVDLSSHASGDVGSPATKNYLAHKAIISGLDYTFYVRPRSISMVPERRESLKLAPIVLTESKGASWGETNRNLLVKYDEGVDAPGPVPIAYVIFEPKEEAEESDTRILVFTDADFITNLYVDNYSNAEMGINSVNWLVESDYKPLLHSEIIEVKKLNLTSKKKKQVLLILVFFPFVILLASIVLLIRK